MGFKPIATHTFTCVEMDPVGAKTTIELLRFDHPNGGTLWATNAWVSFDQESKGQFLGFSETSPSAAAVFNEARERIKNYLSRSSSAPLGSVGDAINQTFQDEKAEFLAAEAKPDETDPDSVEITEEKSNALAHIVEATSNNVKKVLGLMIAAKKADPMAGAIMFSGSTTFTATDTTGKVIHTLVTDGDGMVDALLYDFIVFSRHYKGKNDIDHITIDIEL